MNFDFRQYLAEAYDVDEKNDMIAEFGKYLDTTLGTTYDPKTQVYSKGALWFAIGHGDNTYRDSRLTVGLRRSQLNDDSEMTTLNFLVNDVGELVAYLDAEDHGLLYNTPAFKTDASGKKTMMKWNIGVTDEQKAAAFGAAADYIEEYFNDASIRDNITNAAKDEYDQTDKTRLLKSLKSREEVDNEFSWTHDDEVQLNNYRAELERVNKGIRQYTKAKEEATRDHDTYAVNVCKNKLYYLTKRQTDLKQDVKDMEADKLKYQKLFGGADADTPRDMKIKALGLTGAESINLSDEELNDMMKKTFNKDGTRRKQRRIKTGDVADAKAIEKKNKSKSLRDELKAELAALRANK